MHTNRVIKEVLKNSNYTESFFFELDALKKIHHNNIPIIYDIYEDDIFYYIIEEYIEGVNLYEFVTNSKAGRVTEDIIIDYGIQLTNVISYLHSRVPNPILFLDLQPQNIIISDNKLYLVDFGSSITEAADERKIILGTLGYASPEQYTGKDIGKTTDIYGIGAILFFMATGMPLSNKDAHLRLNDNISQKFKQIILRCLETDSLYRFESADKLLFQLNSLKNKKTKALLENKPLIISVAGIESKVGTTHIALLMCRFLKKSGYDIAYEENNTSNHIRKYVKSNKCCRYINGVFKLDSLDLIPKYSENVEMDFDYKILIRDEGVYKRDRSYGEFLYLISGSSEWEIDNIKESDIDFDNVEDIIFNLCDEHRLKCITRNTGLMGQIMHYIPADTKLKDEDRLIFNNLFKDILKGGAVCKKEKKASFTGRFFRR